MRLLTIGCGLFAALALASIVGCASLGIGSVADDAKALSISEAAVIGAADVADQAVKTGYLKGAKAQQVATWLTAAGTALNAAYAAYKNGDNHAAVAAQLATVATNVASVQQAATPPGSAASVASTPPS